MPASHLSVDRTFPRLSTSRAAPSAVCDLFPSLPIQHVRPVEVARPVEGHGFRAELTRYAPEARARVTVRFVLREGGEAHGAGVVSHVPVPFSWNMAHWRFHTFSSIGISESSISLAVGPVPITSCADVDRNQHVVIGTSDTDKQFVELPHWTTVRIVAPP